MFKYLNRSISTLVTITIIAIITIILAGGIFIYNYYWPKPIVPLIQTTSNNSNNIETSLTLQKIENFSYDISAKRLHFCMVESGIKDRGYDPHALKLVNGAFSSSGPIYTYSVSIAKDSNQNPLVAFGDLNGDDKADAVVMLNLVSRKNCNEGLYNCSTTDSDISSTLKLIILINQNGQPFQVDSYMDMGPTKRFGHAEIQNIEIENRIIKISEKGNSNSSGIFINDVLLKPGKEITSSYKLVNNKLVIADQSFATTTIPVDWKTYTNNDLDICFKYPPNMSVNASDFQNPELFRLILTDNISDDISISISIGNDDFESCCFNSNEGWSDIPAEILINQIPFYFTIRDDCGMGSCHETYQYSTEINDKCYKIVLSFYWISSCDNYDLYSEGYNNCIAYNASNEKLPEVLNKIISTFEFIK